MIYEDKICPLNIADCESCKWNFGNRKCGIFSIAADMSAIVELLERQKGMLEEIIQK
jgi:hypothetical protein